MTLAAPVTTDDADDTILPVWADVEIEVTLDSGCCDHVMHADEAPGYLVTDSPGSLRGQNFIVGNGHKIPNQGQMNLNMMCLVNGKQSSVNSIFQIADITRPLMSVSRICDQGLHCNFYAKEALVMDKDNQVVARFERRGGLYVAKMTLKSPVSQPNTEGFGRQGN